MTVRPKPSPSPSQSSTLSSPKAPNSNGSSAARSSRQATSSGRSTSILDREGIGGIAAKFVRLLTVKRRLFYVRNMIAAYRRLYDASRGVTRAEVTSASALTGENLAALKQQLKAASGDTEVDFDVKIDPSIIGGLIVKLGSRMVDGSLRTKLNAIRLAMKEVL